MKRPDSFGFAMDFLGDPEAGELLAYIQELEKAQGEWVSVDDRLPEPKVDVFVYHEQRDLVEVRCLVMEESIVLEDMSKTLSPGWYPGGSFGWHTHWQPIPSPPTE